MSGEQDVKPDELRRLSDADGRESWTPLAPNAETRLWNLAHIAGIDAERLAITAGELRGLLATIDALRSGALIVKEPTNEQ